MTPLLTYHRQQGATLAPTGDRVLSFTPDDRYSEALSTGWVVCDRSHWGLIELTGGDRQQYIHNQSTNQIQQLQPGQSCDTVFVNSTGRTLDLATVHILPESLWVMVSPERRTFFMEWFDRFLFPMDKVELADISEQYNILTVMGPQSNSKLGSLSGELAQTFPAGGHQWLDIGGSKILCASGSGLTIEGYTLFIPVENAIEIWQKIIDLGAIPIGDRQWESLRIQQGRPTPDHELTEDYNPLEAGLWDCISFNKGCYIGQETIARLNTYKGVKQRLFGIKLSENVDAQTPIFLGEEKVGKITSVDPDSLFALGYVRTKAGGAGLTVKAGAATGVVVSVPYVSHEYPDL